ncbi:MAG: glutaredoxin 3 [Magnetococcales bacterium]|nr:glutaredoxin 3 [Magnetococcales bacterium]
MPDIEIYSTTVCPYCVRAKQLLEKKKVSYREFNLTKNPELRDEMLQRANGKKTVPQIFINGQHVGGCDDLYALEAAGQLDPLLAC